MSIYSDYDPTSITSILSADSIVDTLDSININYSMLNLGLSTIELTYNETIQPIIDFYNLYASELQKSLDIYNDSYGNWTSYVTTVQANSSKWLQPFTIYYPTLIPEPFTDGNINTINEWVRKYFPIKNTDGTLNYVEGQKFLVNCYTYSYISPDGFTDGILTDSPYSYCNCDTNSGNVYLHCQTKIGGGWVQCNQATYNCNTIIDCYPKQTVNCWYTSPYLRLDGMPITDTSGVYNPADKKENVRSQINANITMQFKDRRETGIRTLLFVVSNCDWEYTESTFII